MAGQKKQDKLTHEKHVEAGRKGGESVSEEQHQKAGRIAHEKGTAHEFSSKEAREAGHKGGEASHGEHRGR